MSKRRLSIGVVATEFPPQVGGMQALAKNLCVELGRTHNVAVYTTASGNADGTGLEVVPKLAARVERDAEVLKAADGRHDIWLMLNGGYAALAPALRAPVAVYFHGNDFLQPWVFEEGWLAGVLRRIPKIWHYADGVRAIHDRALVRRGARAIAVAFANSHATAAVLHERLSVDRSKIVVCHPGVEDRFFQAAPRPACDKTVFLTVSRLTVQARRKNVDGVLHALARLSSEIDFHYYVAGGGDDLERLKQLADHLGLARKVTFTGTISNDELLSLYARADLFILAADASGADVEGFGIVYIEANASGVATLCSSRGGSTDAVQDGITGVITPGSSPQQIEAGIRRYLKSHHSFDRAKMVEFAESFRWHRVAQKLGAHLVAHARHNRASGSG